MTRSDRLKPIQHVAEVRARDAARAFGEAQRRLQDEEHRLRELEAYRDEYLQRFRTLQQQGITVAKMLEYQAFLGKLETALRHQQEIVLQQQADSDRHMATWAARRTHSRAVDRAVENLAQAELKADEQRDQKVLDERNQRRR